MTDGPKVERYVLPLVWRGSAPSLVYISGEWVPPFYHEDEVHYDLYKFPFHFRLHGGTNCLAWELRWGLRATSEVLERGLRSLGIYGREPLEKRVTRWEIDQAFIEGIHALEQSAHNHVELLLSHKGRSTSITPPLRTAYD